MYRDRLKKDTSSCTINMLVGCAIVLLWNRRRNNLAVLHPPCLGLCSAMVQILIVFTGSLRGRTVPYIDFKLSVCISGACILIFSFFL